VKDPVTPSSGKKSGTGERRVHRAVPVSVAPPIPGIRAGSDTEILQKLVRQLRLERGFLQAVLDQMPAGVVLAEAPSGRLILGNNKIEELLRERFFAAPTIDQYSHWKGFRADGTPYTAREWPLARAILFGDVIRGEVIRVRRGDRSFGLFEVSASPIHDEKGLIAAAVASFYDVSDRDWAQQMFGGAAVLRFPRKKR